jgi:hypothetical protein
MGRFLAAVGRARPSRNLMDVMEMRNRRSRAESLAAVRGSQIALNTERINNIRRKAQYEEEAHQKKMQPIPWDAIMDTLPFGKDGMMAQYATRVAKSRGYLEDIGGALATNGYNAESLYGEALEDKTTMTQFIGAGITDARNRLAAIDKELDGKEGAAAEKLTQQKQRLNDMLRQLQGAMKEENKKFETQEEVAAQKLKEEQAFRQKEEDQGLADRRQDEIERHNRAMERAAKAKASTVGPKVGKENKELQRLEDDIMSVAGKLHSVRSGQDITSEAMGSEKDTVVKNLEGRLNTLLKNYKKAGGDPARLGYEKGEVIPVGTIIVNKKTNERMEWDGAEWVPLN